MAIQPLVLNFRITSEVIIPVLKNCYFGHFTFRNDNRDNATKLVQQFSL